MREVPPATLPLPFNIQYNMDCARVDSFSPVYNLDIATFSVHHHQESYRVARRPSDVLPRLQPQGEPSSPSSATPYPSTHRQGNRAALNNGCHLETRDKIKYCIVYCYNKDL